MSPITNAHRIIPFICLASLPLVPAPAVAQQRLVEGIFALGGAMILNEMNERNRGQNTAPRRTQQVDPATAQRAAEEREQMRLVQVRLNTLGFDAGSPDGLSGPKTRRAISDFQASIGMAPTGKLTHEQIAVLYQQSAGIGGGHVGGPQPVYPPSGAFPALVTPAAPPMAATPAFPSLGTPATPTAVAPGAFPALGGAPTPPAPAGNFPALAATAQPVGVPAFPTIGTPVAVATPTNPLVAGSAQASQALPTATSLAEEIIKTPFVSADKQPAILGVTLGSTAEDFTLMLGENAFGNCTGAPGAQQCSRQTATLSDVVKGWVAADGQLWAMARLIQFNEPVPADFIHGQFTQTYPELMAAPGGLVSSGEACEVNAQSVPALAAVFDQRAGVPEATEVPSALLDMAVQCPLAYSLAFNEGNGHVAAVQVLFFDGTSVVRQHVAAHEALQTQLGADLKF